MNLTPTQLRLIELLGDKTLSFGCVIKVKHPNGKVFRFASEDQSFVYLSKNNGIAQEWKSVFKKGFEILGHIPTLSDLHRTFVSLNLRFEQRENQIDFLLRE